MTADIWDPNSWGADPPHEHRIYGDVNAQTWVVVDAVDYQWAIQWRWHFNKPHHRRNGEKQYMARNQSNGRRHAPKLSLHIEIMKRTGKPQPSPLHTIVDHGDGNEFNCRRANLDWSTPKLNNVRVHNGGNHGAGKKSAR